MFFFVDAVDYCAGDPCGTNQSCESGATGPICRCDPGFSQKGLLLKIENKLKKNDKNDKKLKKKSKKTEISLKY